MAGECDAIMITLPLSFVSKSDIEGHNLEMQDPDHVLTSCYLEISMDTDNKKPMPCYSLKGQCNGGLNHVGALVLHVTFPRTCYQRLQPSEWVSIQACI